MLRTFVTISNVYIFHSKMSSTVAPIVINFLENIFCKLVMLMLLGSRLKHLGP